MIQSIEEQWNRVEEARWSLIGRFDGLGNEIANEPPDEGAWSAIQVVCHVTKAEEGALAYIRKKITTPDSIPMAGPGAAFRLGLLRMALRSPLRWKAPAVAANVPDRSDVQETIASWGKLREDWKTFLDEYPEYLLPRAVFKHPRAGRLNIYQTLDFMLEHVEHHSRQVDRILARLSR